jgi:hypothetical protein
MRKLIFAINTTLDGCCDHTKQIAVLHNNLTDPAYSLGFLQ